MADVSDEPVSFPEWCTVLAGDGLDLVIRERYRCSIVAYLHDLKTQRLRASIATAKTYVETGEAKGVTDVTVTSPFDGLWVTRSGGRRNAGNSAPDDPLVSARPLPAAGDPALQA